MGIRRTVLTSIKTLLDGIVVGTRANGDNITLSAVNVLFDPAKQTQELPKISIVPLPESVKVGLLGHFMDSTFRVGIFGYTYGNDVDGAQLFAEDIVDAIEQALCTESAAATFLAATGTGFSVIELGPILNEQLDEVGNLAYFSVPLVVQFVQN